MSSPTVSELYTEYVGRKCLVRVLDDKANVANAKAGEPVGVLMPAVIADARFVWGRRQVLITPFMGRGTIWVDAHRVTVVEEYPADSDDTEHPDLEVLVGAEAPPDEGTVDCENESG